MTPSSQYSSSQITALTGVELARAVKSRDLSPVEIVDAMLDRIDKVNPYINAFITVAAEHAREGAKVAEQAVMDAVDPASLGKVHGVPVTVKDLTPTAGVRTTCGLVTDKDHVPDFDGLTWGRMKAEGALLLGKTSTPPLGNLCVTENDLIGKTNNPYDLARSVGGSSGGAAAALATGLGPMAIGSDGGGSIRVPSAYCGVVGLKASLGRIPLYSEGPVYETVDVVGPMTTTVADAALMLSIMAGPHDRDPFSLPEVGIDYLAMLTDESLRGTRIAFSLELGRGPVEADVAAGVTAAARHFEEVLGASVDAVEVEMPDFVEYFKNYWEPAFALYMKYEDRYDMSNYPPLMEWIERGSKVSAVDHIRTAQIHRAQLHDALADVFDDHELLITPTVPQTAFLHPDPAVLGPTSVAGVEVGMPSIDFSRFTDPMSNAGYPAITVPCGFSPQGLPIGLQIVGRHRADASVLRAAAVLERSLNVARQRPSLIPALVDVES